MILTLNFLPYSRPYIMVKTIQDICKVSPNYKSMFDICIHSGPGVDVSESVNICRNNGILVHPISYPTHDYLRKVENAANNTTPYSLKIDEDIFMNHHVLEYFLDNHTIMEDAEVMAVTPTLSTGIPTTEMFIEDVFSQSEKDVMFDMFNKTVIPNIWGVDYTSLNQRKDKWDAGFYYDNVEKINHHFKGIHPLRVSSPIQNKMMEIIRSKKDKMMLKQNYRIEKKHFPYFCNSVFFIKTSRWKEVIKDSSLFRDIYDEVPFNLYKNMKGYKLAFIRNANCIHPSYNTIPDYIAIAQRLKDILNSWV